MGKSPSRYKMSPPKYQSIQHAEFPKVSVGENSWVEVIAGEYNGSKGIASTFSPIHMMNARLKKVLVLHLVSLLILTPLLWL